MQKANWIVVTTLLLVWLSGISKCFATQSVVSISINPMTERSSHSDKGFTRMEGAYAGIDHFADIAPVDIMPPFWYGRGLATGDVNNDGFVDLVIATKRGIKLYLNNQGKGFTQQALDLAKDDNQSLFIAALVDIDNDGWLDIFYSAYGDGNYIAISREGRFTDASLQKLPSQPKVVSMAASFGDFDKDGDLDIALGNWFVGSPKRFPTIDATNFIEINNGDGFTTVPLDGVPGETLSILFTDINADDNLDLIVGNDFRPPDYYYLGDGEGNLAMQKRDNPLIPISAETTMSIDTADIDNDLDLDIYITQVAGGVSKKSTRIKSRHWSEYCIDVQDVAHRQLCEKSVGERKLFSFPRIHRAGRIKNCRHVEKGERRNGCIAAMVFRVALRARKPELCEKIPVEYVKLKCRYFFEPGYESSNDEKLASIPSKFNRNVLLQFDGTTFVNKAEALSVSLTEFSWNGRVFDADNDGWQDIYVVNGIWHRMPSSPEKFFFHNQQGQGFSKQTDEFGLQNYMLQSAYSLADLDNDGDLDIIANSIGGPVWIYWNNEQENRTLSVRLVDEIGNRNGIGAKIIIRYGKDDKFGQIREIKSGGGFLSYDDTIAHFGVGLTERINSLRVTWSDGESTVLDQSFVVGHTITIRRELN
jgi:hypothetical protein